MLVTPLFGERQLQVLGRYSPETVRVSLWVSTEEAEEGSTQMDKLDIDHLIHLANTDPQAFYQVRMALIQQTMSGLTNIPASKLADLQNTIDSTRALAVTPSSAAKQLTNLLDDRHEALRMLWEELEVRLRKLAEAMPNGKSPED